MAPEVRQLHKSVQLERLLEGAAGQDPAFICDTCDGVRFVPCPACADSRKVFDEEEDRTLRFSNCNENGLVRCGEVLSKF
ncbi:hypothetical protein D1007_34390 [Hordeum vulgare]|nr:hypothetical protein D1007_34390 [Hordeum vulgare]